MARALEFSLIGEKVAADKALDWGLINPVVEDEPEVNLSQLLSDLRSDATATGDAVFTDNTTGRAAEEEAGGSSSGTPADQVTPFFSW